jgi:hypothetical protein
MIQTKARKMQSLTPHLTTRLAVTSQVNPPGKLVRRACARGRARRVGVWALSRSVPLNENLLHCGCLISGPACSMLPLTSSDLTSDF